MGLFIRRPSSTDPHAEAAELAAGALDQFRWAHEDLRDANDILAAAKESDEALIADLQTRVSSADSAIAGNAKVADKLAELLGL